MFSRIFKSMIKAARRNSNKTKLTARVPKLVAMVTKAIVNKLGKTTVMAPIKDKNPVKTNCHKAN